MKVLLIARCSVPPCWVLLLSATDRYGMCSGAMFSWTRQLISASMAGTMSMSVSLPLISLVQLARDQVIYKALGKTPGEVNESGFDNLL
jgi:hypothetical protein